MEKKNLHFITNFMSTEDLTNWQSKIYTDENNEWENLTIDYKKPADYYVICNHPYHMGKKQHYDPLKTIVYHVEPMVTRHRWNDWSNQESFLHKFEDKNIAHWGISWNMNELKTKKIFKLEEDKNKISTITSDLSYLPGHKLRLNFLKYLDILPKFNITPDIYGRNTLGDKSPLMKLKNYRGGLNGDTRKDGGLMKYHYHFAGENTQEDGYFSEKLMDSILLENLTFYHGCPNVNKWINQKAFIKIDLNRPKQSLEIIINAMRNNEREKRLKYIKEAKQKILNELNIMPYIDSIINKKSN